MSTARDVIDIIEAFAEVPITALTKIVESKGFDEPLDELVRLVKLQKAAQNYVREREEVDPVYAEALYNLADTDYANEDEMQTNVDPLELPFDISEADEGTWVAAWVWLPNDAVEREVWRLKEEARQKKLQEQRSKENGSVL